MSIHFNPAFWQSQILQKLFQCFFLKEYFVPFFFVRIIQRIIIIWPERQLVQHCNEISFTPTGILYDFFPLISLCLYI